MNRNRGPLSHVQIDDGDESDWDTVTEVKEKNSGAQHPQQLEQQETPRDDDTSYYQPSSIDIPVIADNVSLKKKEQTNVTAQEVVTQRRQSISSISSKENFTHLSEKGPPLASPSNSISRRTEHSLGNKNTDVNLRVAGKYIAVPGTSDKNRSQNLATYNSTENSPRSATSVALVDEIRSKSSVIIDAAANDIMEKAHQVSEHSIVISDSGVVDETVPTVEAMAQNNDANKKQPRKWTSILMPSVNKKAAAAKFSAAINQPLDENFNGENYFDLFRQSRYEYKFAQSPSGADEKFMLPRENPTPKTMRVVNRIEIIAQRSLAEFFGIIRAVFAVAIALLVETSKTIIGGLIQPMIVASITIFGSYFLQPILVALFNYIIAPLLSFIHNVFSASFRSLQPFFNLLGQFFFNLAELVRSFRLVDVRLAHHGSNETSDNDREHTLTVGTLQPV